MPSSPRRPKQKEDRHFVAALARGLSVLACFRTGEKVLSNQELAERCRLPKSTVSRLTYTLTRLGYLTYADGDTKYRLGTATLALGSAMLARMNARQLARPLMQEMADATGGIAALGTYAQLNMIYIEMCRSRATVTIALDVGSRLPVGSTAMGRAYLATIPAAERRAIMAEIRANDPARWPALRRGIEKALDDYERLGCACSFGDWQKDLNGIATGIRPASGSQTLVLSCAGPAYQMKPEFLLEVARPHLLDIVRRLEVTLAVDGD